MSKKVFILISVIIVFVISFSAITLTNKDENATYIYFIGSKEKEEKSFAKPIMNSIEIALDEINQLIDIKSGEKGSIKIAKKYNSKCNEEDAYKATQKVLKKNKAPIIIGGLCSDETIGIMKAINELGDGGVLLSPSSTSSAIAYIDGNVFLGVIDNKQRAEKLAETISKIETSFISLTRDTEYARNFSKNLTKNLEDLNSNISEIRYKDYDNLDIEIAKLPKTNNYGIIVNSQSEYEAVDVVRKLRDAGLKNKLYGNFVFGEYALKELGELLNGSYALRGLDEGGDKIEEFTLKYNDEFGELSQSSYAFSAYDLTRALAEAILNTDGGANAVSSYLYNEKFNFLRGEFSFDKNGSIVGLDNIGVKKIKDNRFIEF